MERLSVLFCVLLAMIAHIYCEEPVPDDEELDTSTEPMTPQDVVNDILEDDPQDSTNDTELEASIAKFEEYAARAYKFDNTLGYTTDDVDREHEKMIVVLDELTEFVKDPNNAYEFLKTKGINRVALNNLKVDNPELKAKILILLKTLFNEVPSTIISVMPITMVDRLLDIFENENLALKTHTLDILYFWLPDNPKVQARVMKLKGLQPFYEQLSALDTNVIKMMLELFNKILTEHVKARSEAQKSVIDAEELKFYQRIGLLERMSSPMMCNGLLNIFAKTWRYNTKDNNIVMSVFELLTNVKQYCIKTLIGKPKAVKLFEALAVYAEEPENKPIFILKGLNQTHIAQVIKEYIKTAKGTVKDEF